MENVKKNVPHFGGLNVQAIGSSLRFSILRSYVVHCGSLRALMKEFFILLTAM